MLTDAPDGELAPAEQADQLDLTNGRLRLGTLHLTLLQHPALSLLDLAANSLGDEGVGMLVVGLRQPGCAAQLRYLGLAIPPPMTSAVNCGL